MDPPADSAPGSTPDATPDSPRDSRKTVRGNSREVGRPRLSFGAGGWVVILGVLLTGAVFVWRLGSIVGNESHAVGDGSDPATYGFDLSNLTVPSEVVVGSGLPRDGIPVLDMPPLWAPAQVDSLAEVRRGKYLVSHDRVIGVVVGSEARAYPIQVLNWHEVVNDTLGGVPIVVTYSPLCDAAVVWDRRPAAMSQASDPRPAAEMPESPASAVLFGHSGLLYNSDVLLYDRTATDAAAPTDAGLGLSLWCPLTGSPIAGPAVGARLALRPIACQLAHWSEWRAQHPETSLLARDEARKDRYKRNPYVSYYGNDVLRFPVAPLPPRDERPYKTRCVLIGPAKSAVPYFLPEIRERAGEAGVWTTGHAGMSVTFRYSEALVPAVWVEAGDLPVRHAFWFAAYAMGAVTTSPGESATIR